MATGSGDDWDPSDPWWVDYLIAIVIIGASIVCAMLARR